MDWNLITVAIITGLAGLIGAALGAWIGAKITERATREATLEAQRRSMTYDEHQKTLRLYERVTDVQEDWSRSHGKGDYGDLSRCIRDVRLLKASTLHPEIPPKLENIETLLTSAQSAIDQGDGGNYMRHHYAVSDPLGSAAAQLTEVAQFYSDKMKDTTV